jgi:ferric-dicitrate binding protein FerR (iron transport regulator)
MGMMVEPADRETEQRARRRRRSIALALALGAVVLIFYALTIVKLGPGLFERPL